MQDACAPDATAPDATAPDERVIGLCVMIAPFGGSFAANAESNKGQERWAGGVGIGVALMPWGLLCHAHCSCGSHAVQ